MLVLLKRICVLLILIVPQAVLSQDLMGDGDMFALSYKWTIHAPGQPFDIVGILVGRVQNGKLVEEWGANYTLTPTGDD